MRKVLVQSIIAFLLGILIYLAGNQAGLLPGVLIPLGVLLIIAGAIAFILGLVLKEPRDTRK